MKGNKRVRRVVVSADGAGVVSHAGVGLLREMAECTGLVEGVSGALLDTYKGNPVHAPGRVFTDLAVAVADGADAISVLGDREELFGPVASMPTPWRVLDRIDEDHLDRVRRARATGRCGFSIAGSEPGRVAADRPLTRHAASGDRPDDPLATVPTSRDVDDAAAAEDVVRCGLSPDQTSARRGTTAATASRSAARLP